MSYHKNSGSFTKGQKAWNKQNIYKTCIVCGKKFKTTKSRFNQQKFCSKECQYKYKRKDTKRFKIYNLYKQGKTYREIADLIGMKIGSICHYIYTEGLRERWGNDISGFSYREALKKKLGIKECELCGYNRITEVAHIIEANRNEDGTVALTYKTGRASSDFYKVRSTWQSEFKQQPASNPYVLQTSENVNYLNLPQIVKDFLIETTTIDKNKKQYTSYNIKGSKSNIINFLNAIGLYVTPTDATLNDIEQYTTTFKYLANAIGNLITRIQLKNVVFRLLIHLRI